MIDTNCDGAFVEIRRHFPQNMHTPDRPIASLRVASRRGNRRYFPWRSRHVPVVSRRMRLQGARAPPRVKNRKVSRRNWPMVHSSTQVLPSSSSSGYRSDSRWIAWSFVRRDGTRCPDRRAVIEGSFHGVRLETLNLSPFPLLFSLPKVEGFPFVFLHFFPFFTSPLSSGRQLSFTYVHIVCTREAVYERGQSRFRYISVVDMYISRAFCTFSTLICTI